MSEIPVYFRPRRLPDWINPTGAKKVHSLIDKVYKRKNLEMAWEKVCANRGSWAWMGRIWRNFLSKWISSWIGCTGNFGQMSINHDRGGRCRYRRRESQASIAS
jgi:hypothetical protein